MKSYLKRTLLAVALIPLLGSASISATTMLEEINVRADRQVPTEESVTIREVKESSARDLGEALQSVPGLNSVNKGAIANDIVLHGLQGDDINVFLDGVRLYGGCPSRMDPPSFHFDFAEVEQIKVIKGPYDLQNPGSMGGMVNAISKKPPMGHSATLSATYGSDELINLSGTASIASDKGDVLGGYAYKSSLSPRSGDGLRQIEVYPAASNPMQDRRYRADLVNSEAYAINTAWIKGGYNFTSDSRTELGYSYQNAEQVFYPYLWMDAEYDRTSRVNWTLKVENLDAAVDAIDLQLYWNQVEHLMHDEYRRSSLPAAVTRDYSMQTDSKTSVYGAKAKGDWVLGEGKLTSGVDYYYRNWDAVNEAFGYTMMDRYKPQAMLPDIDVNNLGAFVEYSQPLAQAFEIKGGARIDYTTTKANALSQTRLVSLYETNISGQGLADNHDFSEASGNVQLAWQVNPVLQVFSGIGIGTRTPDPQELYIGLDRSSMAASWVGNPNLDSTFNRQIDLGAKVTGDNFFLNASVFYSSLKDYITLTQGTVLSTGFTAKTYQNVDATLWGGELNSQLALPMDLYLRGSLAYVRGENEDSNQPLAEIPPLNGSASIRWDNDTYFAEITERFAAGQDRVDPVLQEETTAGWGVTDIKAGANWGSWSLAGGVNNLFDIYYVTHLSYLRDPFTSGEKVPEVGAFAYTTLSYKF